MITDDVHKNQPPIIPTTHLDTPVDLSGAFDPTGPGRVLLSTPTANNNK